MPNMALKRDARNAGFGLFQRLRGRPLALLYRKAVVREDVNRFVIQRKR